jgi:two-component sensor histidine kinase
VTIALEASTRSKLLYIDDDKALCYLVKKGLERRGYSVETAHSGPEGLAMAEAAHFDLIAIDHYMPGQDGLVTLSRLRTLESSPPVVYVTGSDESRIAVAALKEGAIDYVVKTGSDDFLDLLTSALRQAEEQVRLRSERDAAAEALLAANARLEAIVAHQAVLIREVNHRVANSLQLVSSLVHMQLSAVKGGPAADALRDTQARIDAIMQVHRRLYTSEDVQVVDMQEYLAGLTAELEQSLSVGAHRTLRLDAAPIKLATDMAVSVGVIVAELVTNACKYAYGENEAGEVRIVFDTDEENACRLVVEDDGPGFSASAPARGTGLGRTVISAMARNLNSKIAFDPDHKGARAVLSFRG